MVEVGVKSSPKWVGGREGGRPLWGAVWAVMTLLGVSGYVIPVEQCCLCHREMFFLPPRNVFLATENCRQTLSGVYSQHDFDGVWNLTRLQDLLESSKYIYIVRCEAPKDVVGLTKQVMGVLSWLPGLLSFFSYCQLPSHLPPPQARRDMTINTGVSPWYATCHIWNLQSANKNIWQTQRETFLKLCNDQRRWVVCRILS